MRARCLVLFAIGILLLPGAAAHAQDATDSPKGDAHILSSHAATDESPVSRQGRLDRLFERLSAATSAEDAKRYESSIEALWQRSGSDTADLLTARALELAASDDRDGAMKLLAAALDAKPDYAEGWNKRATLFFLRGDYGHAMRDIRETLRYEPRHYGAWAALGRILEQSGDERRALNAYRRALAIHPQLEGLQDQVRNLANKVLGEEI
ncbi:tetratricopeptide repeat protein [Terrihabitans sp. B22-R8]|uniref:tetratricopeptide repeat protein n=1 Tax=Terrihabitans sp. B22-R8 TaxID=3425128 RepID=UPI00403D3174